MIVVYKPTNMEPPTYMYIYIYKYIHIYLYVYVYCICLYIYICEIYTHADKFLARPQRYCYSVRGSGESCLSIVILHGVDK